MSTSFFLVLPAPPSPSKTTFLSRLLGVSQLGTTEVNKGRYFRANGELQLMAGPFVAALEYATGAVAR